MSENTTHRVNESADKINLKTKIVRGNGTRDQDKITVKVKGNDPGKVVTKLNETVNRLTGTAQNLRDTQPEDTDD